MILFTERNLAIERKYIKFIMNNRNIIYFINKSLEPKIKEKIKEKILSKHV